MRKFLVLLLVLPLFGVDKLILKKPPESLSKYYPPKSKRFEWIGNMFEMATSITGIFVNINEGRWDRAKEWAERLSKTYERTSKMVPEWKKFFKLELARNVVREVERKNVKGVVRAVKKLGKTCQRCHSQNLLSVKLLYHFPSYENIKVEDPVDFSEVKFHKYMEKLAKDFKTIRVFLVEREYKKLSKKTQEFVERFKGLKQTCQKCHNSDEEVAPFVGKSFEKALNNLLTLVKNKEFKKVPMALMISASYCSKCHNVHQIPAIVREAFSR